MITLTGVSNHALEKELCIRLLERLLSHEESVDKIERILGSMGQEIKLKRVHPAGELIKFVWLVNERWVFTIDELAHEVFCNVGARTVLLELYSNAVDELGVE